MTDRCIELTGPGITDRCGLAGTRVRLPCPAGRPDAVGGPYCEDHGGEQRARAEAARDWNYLAPESVGGAETVQRVGCWGLSTPDRYVVLRQTPADQGGRWLAWRGLGSLLTPVQNPQAQPNKRGGRRHRSGGGTNAFASREDAELEARRVWALELGGHVGRIREARGETLDWGVPVEPAREPILIVLEQGDSRSAWDLAVTLDRQDRTGLATFSGLRPSGEVA